MKNQMFKRMICWLLVACMVLPFVPAASAARVSWKQVDREITVSASEDRRVQTDGAAERDESEMVRVSIVLEGASTVEAGYATMGIGSNAEAMAYSANLQAVQKRMEKTISARVLNGRPLDVVWNMTLVGNIISAWVPYGKLDQIAAIPGVKTVAMEAQYEPCRAEVVEGVEPNTYPSSGMIGSVPLWDGGYTGAGTRIAIIDTGTDTAHQSFSNDAYRYALMQNAEAKGMSYEAYVASLDLLDAAEIAEVLPELHVAKRNANVTAEDLYTNEKQAFGFNYVDGNLNIGHMNDAQGEHGSHVAGISTANRYIVNEYDSFVDARDSVMMLGVAPDAQLVTMKVFGESSPYDSDYMAAIEDAILLNCDAVNLSLGTTMPGSPYTDVYSGLLEMMQETDTVVVISAGNAYNWASASLFGYLYSDDVNFNMVGSPGSYESAFTVASVNNDGMVGYFFEAGGRKAFYVETFGFGNTALAFLDTSANQDGTEYDYIFLDGLGEESDYAGIDVTGKVVFVQRGTLNFAVKANNALSRGAVAVVVYNNQPGVSNMDLTGLNYSAPVVSITQAEGAAIRSVSEDKGTHLTGKLTVYGKMGIGMNNSEYYTMSDFSSWGVPDNLTLKPEITAPGGEIYSVWGSTPSGGGTDQYVHMSGTSMAAPQITGMAALLAQYYQENGMAERSGISARHLAQSLLMSTAVPLREEASGGNYYALMNQGAGLARVDLAANAESYILVDGQDDGKVKAELGDDPDRTGVYAFDFTIHNLTDSEQSYALSADLFRQDVFEYMEDSDVWLLDTWTTGLDAKVTFSSANMGAGAGVSHDLNGDGVTDAADADWLTEYAVGNVTELKGEGDLSGDGQINSYDAHLLLASLTGDTVTVPAGGTATVSVTVELTEEAKAELDAETPNGTYVEAFVFAESVADAEGNVGTTHSIPVLAFYGDWSDPSMYERGTLLDLIYMTSNVAPYQYRFIGPYGNALGIDYGDGNEFYFGGNPILDDATYLPERNAFSSTGGSTMTEQTFSMIRGAGAGRIQVLNAETGEIYFEKNLGELYPAYYSPAMGTWDNSIQYAKLNWKGTDASGQALPEGTKVAVSLTTVSPYYRQADGSYSFEDVGAGSTLTTTFTIDNTAPEMRSIDESALDSGMLTVTAKDNEYVAAIALMNAAGTKTYAVATPNQTEQNVDAIATLELDEVYGSKFLIAVYDYALNVSYYEMEIDLGEAPREYFTAYDRQSGCYVSVDKTGNVSKITEAALPVAISCMEYVGGYAFSITDDNSFCVANDEDLTYTQRICQLDEEAQWLITYFNDIAYNPQDGKLYGQFYSQLNSEMYPYLCTIDMLSGELDIICEMPLDVNTMAIDGQGNFYSAGYSSNILYTYTLDSLNNGSPKMTQIGEMGYYYSTYLTSMAWDHNEDKLYWAFPNTLLELNPKTAEVTLIGYQEAILVGLYTRPAEDEGVFDPVDTVTSVELSHSATRVLKGAAYTLEATVWPWNASDRSVTWMSSDESIATVDQNGTVTGVTAGKCTITAISNLNPTVAATCEIEVFELEKTLNGLVWDEEGAIWMSEFTTTELPDYTKLSAAGLENDLASATVDEKGNIYAASLDVNTLKSRLYKLDPVTYMPTLIGASTDGYVDIAPAPGQGENKLMAVYGGNILNVDAATGDYYNHYYMFSYNLVALAYVGTDYDYTEWDFDTQVDWYFIIDRVGYVYLMGFLEQDGSYYYLEHDQLAPGGIYTKLNFEMDTPYFGSAYFDGEMLYYSAYKESKNNVTLMAIDVAGGSKACYEVGTFADGVWPVAGLMELDKTPENHYDMLVTNSAPVVVEPELELMGIREEKTEGTLNSAIAPMSSSESKDGLIYVNVTLPYADTNADMTVTFDTAKLELVDVSGSTTAFAWKAEGGEIDLSLAEADVIADTRNVARLTFRGTGEGSTTVSIVTGGLGSEGCGYDERIELELAHICPSEHFVDVNPGDWWHEAVDYVVSAGYMNGMDATHYGPAATMNRAQFVTVLYRMEGEPAVNNTGVFTDVPAGQFYTNAAYWALENGITTGATADTFNPGGKLTRTELVTFMYRYAKLKGYDVSTGDLSAYQDADQVLAFAVEPWSWAVRHGIVTGMTADTLAPMNLTNRAQAAVIFQRFDATFK